ncbi:MAG: FeoB-associated Cys-rich membrane protein [Firmicutes bacterium]|nr:FeoB-associated Cys-rich membrane protein [Bacillota bacterium]
MGDTNILSTLIVALVLAAVVFLIVRKMIRDRKAGKHSCGCGCSACPMSGSCHNKERKA